MELIGGGMNLREAARHLGINHRTVAVWVKPKDKEPTVQLIASSDEDASREKRPHHGKTGTECIRGIISANERTGKLPSKSPWVPVSVYILSCRNVHRAEIVIDKI